MGLFSALNSKKGERTQLEIEFVANKGRKKYDIQSTLIVAEEEKREQEFLKACNSFKKVVVLRSRITSFPGMIMAFCISA